MHTARQRGTGSLLQGTWELGGQCEPTGHDDACTVCTALHMSKVLCVSTGAMAGTGPGAGTAGAGGVRSLGQHLEHNRVALGRHCAKGCLPLASWQ